MDSIRIDEGSHARGIPCYRYMGTVHPFIVESYLNKNYIAVHCTRVAFPHGRVGSTIVVTVCPDYKRLGRVQSTRPPWRSEVVHKKANKKKDRVIFLHQTFNFGYGYGFVSSF